MALLTFSLSAYADTTDMGATDSGIAADIQSQIALDEDLNSVNISVTCENGVVKLVGQVNSEKEKEDILDIAESTPGVIKIDSSHLTVNIY